MCNFQNYVLKNWQSGNDNKNVPSEIISTQCAPRQTNHTLESELCKNANITYLF